jgi:hypothetical protein
MKILVVLALVRAGLAVPNDYVLRDLGGLLDIYPPQNPVPFNERPSSSSPGLVYEFQTKIQGATHSQPAVSSNLETEILSSTSSPYPSKTDSRSPSTVPTTTSKTQVATQSTLTQQGLSNESASGPGTTHWKLVGISVIVVSAIATMILSIVFFDQWTGFLKDVIFGCGRKRKTLWLEQLLPDSEKIYWQAKDQSPKCSTTRIIGRRWWTQEKDSDQQSDSESYSPFPQRPQPALISVSPVDGVSEDQLVQLENSGYVRSPYHLPSHPVNAA